MRFRTAEASDARSVALLHAESWRRHYRGSYSDSFLDGDVEADRIAVWTSRLERPEAPTCTILAEEGDALVGFVHTVLDEDPVFGSLVDNLHVAFDRKRGGVGTALLGRAATAALRRSAEAGRSDTTGLYLWVLEQNVPAQRFYEARGGVRADRRLVACPGGVAGRLVGSPSGIRYVWPDPSVLVA